MQTKIVPVREGLQQAAKLIRSGEIVAFPTETVYGLGANAFDPVAVEKIFTAKGRPQDNPLIVHVCDRGMIASVAKDISSLAWQLIDAFLPGSLTVVLPKREEIPNVVTAGFATVGVRMPLSQEARDFIHACGVPIAAPSANTSGRPSPTRALHVMEDLQGKIPLILQGEDCRVGIESTVVECTGDFPVLLRPGIVTAEEIRRVCGTDVLVPDSKNKLVNSPGVRYRHYAPSVPVYLNCDGDLNKIGRKVAELPHCVVLCPQNVADSLNGIPCMSLGSTAEEAAQRIFDDLRKAEKTYENIVAVWTDRSPKGQGVLNRLTKSCGGKIF